MTTQQVLNPEMIPHRIANSLDLDVIESLYGEATSIKRSETQLQMRRVALVSTMREKGLSWDSCGWFFGATGEAVRKVYGYLVGDGSPTPGGRPEVSDS